MSTDPKAPSSKPPLHPLDATELELKRAARDFRTMTDSAASKSDGMHPKPPDADESLLRLKKAARLYGEAWRKYVRRVAP